MVQVLIAVIVTLIVAAPLSWFLASVYHKKVSETKLGNAGIRPVRSLMKL